MSILRFRRRKITNQIKFLHFTVSSINLLKSRYDYDPPSLYNLRLKFLQLIYLFCFGAKLFHFSFQIVSFSFFLCIYFVSFRVKALQTYLFIFFMVALDLFLRFKSTFKNKKKNLLKHTSKLKMQRFRTKHV